LATPLFPITRADLGLMPEKVKESLYKIFWLAHP